MGHTEIYQHESSVEVLRSLLKTTNGREVSIRKLSKDLGYASDRTVGMILKGQRLVTDDLAGKVSKKLELTTKEKQYLALLVKRDRLKSKNESAAEVEKEILAIKPRKFRNLKVSDQQFTRLTDWYSFSVLRIIASATESVSFKVIASRLRGEVAADEVSKICDSLLSLGFIQKSKNSFTKNPRFDFVRTMSDVPSEVIRQYHRNQLSRASAVLDEQSVLDRHFVAKTFAMSPDKISEAKNRLAELLELFSSEFCNEGAGMDLQVYQLNLQFYLQTK